MFVCGHAWRGRGGGRSVLREVPRWGGGVVLSIVFFVLIFYILALVTNEKSSLWRTSLRRSSLHLSFWQRASRSCVPYTHATLTLYAHRIYTDAPPADHRATQRYHHTCLSNVVSRPVRRVFVCVYVSFMCLDTGRNLERNFSAPLFSASKQPNGGEEPALLSCTYAISTCFRYVCVFWRLLHVHT